MCGALTSSNSFLMASHARPVLCVDLDGTLVRTDTLVEMWLSVMRRNPLSAALSITWLLKGKAYFKERLAMAAELDISHLPYNEELIEYLTTQKSAGRHLVLTTACHESVARSIADHIGLFDEVIASTKSRNLRGHAKASELASRFGRGRYSYAGNDVTDLPIWKDAASAIVVSPSDGLAGRIETEIEAHFPDSASRVHSLIRSMRVYQWVKNSLVFVPVIAAGAILEPEALLGAFGAFIAFSLLASGVYIINDLADLPADRLHERKRNRPFASGELPLEWGLLAGPLFILAALLLGWAIAPLLVGVLVLYAIATTVYSFYLKTQPLVDVFTLAALYTLRIVAGGAATGYVPSIWLLSFSGFFFLSLAFLKRFVEMSETSGAGGEMMPRRGYYANEIVPLIAMGTASGFTSSVVLALYLNSTQAAAIYARPEYLWALVPIFLFLLCRIWLSGWRGYVDDDPIVYAARDWVSWIGVALMTAIFLSAL